VGSNPAGCTINSIILNKVIEFTKTKQLYRGAVQPGVDVSLSRRRTWVRIPSPRPPNIKCMSNFLIVNEETANLLITNHPEIFKPHIINTTDNKKKTTIKRTKMKRKQV